MRQDLNSSGESLPVLLLSKWLKEARNSLSCSCVMPLLSRVRICRGKMIVIYKLVQALLDPSVHAYLVLDLVDGPVDGGDELLPADPESLHGVLRVAVLEDEGLLDLLVDALQLLQVRLELVHRLLVLTQTTQLLLQRTLQCECVCEIENALAVDSVIFLRDHP